MVANNQRNINFFLIAMILIGITVLGGMRVVRLKTSPNVVFLTDRAGAQWIKYDTDFELLTTPSGQIRTGFGYTFKTSQPIEGVRITLQALKHCRLILDDKTIFDSPYEFDQWKQSHEITIPFTIEPGSHEIVLIVTSGNSHPAVIAYSDVLPIHTGPDWIATRDGENWKPAVPASVLNLPNVSKEFPRALDGFAKIFPYLAIVFTVVCLLSWQHDRLSEELLRLFKWWTDPSRIRFVLLFLWLLLSVNNLFKIRSDLGYDLIFHIRYISFLYREVSLPLASDGWQMFQAPLYYLISAPLYGLLIQWFQLSTVIQLLRIIPIVCGLLQIEIVYCASRIVFPQRKLLQCIAIVTGAVLPMHTYICQVLGNEPLAGCFISLVILYCLKLIVSPQKEQTPRFFVLLGLFLGLALLAKATAVLLSPVIVLVIFAHGRMVKGPTRYVLSSVSLVFGIALLTAGWYYFRNYLEFGSFFIGGWDPSRGIYWWQDPSYRTWSQLLSFGQSLIYPVYSGATGIWDGLYSTLWLDGFNSAEPTFKQRPPWNINFMTAGALLAVIPTLFIFSSIGYGIRKENPSRNAVIFSVGTLLLFLAAVFDLYVQLPIYSTAKSTYMLGLLPCFAILAAAGAEPFLGNKLSRSITIASFSCWAFAAYAAYFVLNGQP